MAISVVLRANSAPLTVDLTASVGTTGQIKVWDGASFVVKPVKVWNGTSWEIKPLKHWNGASWVLTNY